MKLIGVGFGRTGTMSLKGALEQLGANPCFHMIDLIMGENRERDLANWKQIADGEPVDWHEVFDGSEATVDWPAAARWRESSLLPRRPVLLNYRDFDGFYKSCQHTILAVKQAAMAGELEQDANREPPSPILWEVIEKLIWQGDFQGRFEDKEWVRQMYFERIETIKNEIPLGPPDRLGARQGRLGTARRRARRRRRPTSRSRTSTTRTSSGPSSAWPPSGPSA